MTEIAPFELLAGWIRSLREGNVLPEQVPLRSLVDRALEHFYAIRTSHPEAAAQTLPQVAALLLLQTRLLLPKTDCEPDDDTDFWEALETEPWNPEPLAEVEVWVQFLSHSRETQRWILPAAHKPLAWPRREDRHATHERLDRLVEAAQNTLRDVSVAELSQDRLTLEQAYQTLTSSFAHTERLKFCAWAPEDWNERTIYFTALLEGLRLEKLHAAQASAYSEIDVWIDKNPNSVPLP
ncbi:MAG: segregation/condensation protein A [Deinococcaceae bacterium]